MFFSVYHIPFRFSIQKARNFRSPPFAFKEIYSHVRFLVKLTSHHDFRDNLKNLLMATAATGRTVRDSLNVSESRKYTTEILMRIERIRDICVSDLFAMTNHIILYHKITSDHV